MAKKKTEEEERKKIIEEGLQKAMVKIQKMLGNRDLDDVTRRVRVTKKLSLEINCIREDEDEESLGDPIFFEVYAILKGEDHDCVTITPGYENIEEEVMYLLNCYV